MGKKVLVTGGCGFIGRQVVEELLGNGYSVAVLDNLVEQVHGDSPPRQHPRAEYYIGDVRDSALVRNALGDADYVIHLAAEVGVGQSMYEIARYVGANDLATAVLLECLIERPVRRIVVASSMSVYGEGLYESVDGTRFARARRCKERLKAQQWDPVDAEGKPLKPLATDEEKPVDLASIYALTKYAQEKAVLIFGEAYPVEAVALRLFNVFGPGQALSNPYTGVLANFASRLANRQRPLIFEDGQQKRDFVNVQDVARAFRLALESGEAAGQVINIGSGKAYTIRQVSELLAEAMGLDIQPEILGRLRSGDIRHCFADISKARELLGFEPSHLLEDAVGEFAEWVRTTDAVDNAAKMRQQLEARGLVS
ncbi:NAD-dependent epimerase/dehydratase family protein [Chelativorans sp. Marseille-P2723]|uniref:NAD-dependent epimerase/dehydratase family protein n=1 Tax=Chelativorans sp. Marseille-P2723 TaxID=2709133 RepID=UPI00156F3D3E|nr:NAD-dependent epimerase/dehydratase family protein [Chelativorans sp. Marseille-P2723]